MSSEELYKKFHTLSSVAKYHLAPKLFGDTPSEASNVYSDERIRRWLMEMEKMEGPKETSELQTTAGKHLIEVMDRIDSIQLKSDQLSNADEFKKLNACKESLRNQISTILNSIKEYIISIINLEEIARNGVVAEIEKNDRARRIKHNKLIDEINVFNRSLQWWLGKFDPGNIADPKMEEMYEKQQEKFISEAVERFDVPLNGICPDAINLKDRYQITLWAEQVFKDLAYLRTGKK